MHIAHVVRVVHGTHTYLTVTLSDSLFVCSMSWNKKKRTSCRCRCDKNGVCNPLQMSRAKNANRIIASHWISFKIPAVGRDIGSVAFVFFLFTFICSTLFFSRTVYSRSTSQGYFFSLFFCVDGRGFVWCVYGRFWYKCIVFSGMLNKRRRIIYHLVLLFPPLYAMACANLTPSNNIHECIHTQKNLPKKGEEQR